MKKKETQQQKIQKKKSMKLFKEACFTIHVSEMKLIDCLIKKHILGGCDHKWVKRFVLLI